MIAEIRSGLSGWLVSLAALIAPPNPKRVPKREGFDVVVPKESRVGARSDFAERFFGGMKDIQR
jgi:hypothetical protein